MKIVSRGRVLNSEEFYRKKQIRKRRKLILWLVLFFSLIFALVYFSRQNNFRIAEVLVPEAEISGRGEIVSATRDLLRGFYLWLVPRDSLFVFSRSAIKGNLLREFPRLESVSLDLDDNRNLLVRVREREPLALYCGESADHEEGSSECYFLDKEGLIFAPAPSFSRPIYFIFSTENGLESPVGQKLLSPEEFVSLWNFMQTLETLDIRPTSLKISDSYLNLTFDEGGEIIWQRGSDLALVYSNLKAFLSDEAIVSEENFLGRVLYIDLGVENKIRWKFKEE